MGLALVVGVVVVILLQVVLLLRGNRRPDDERQAQAQLQAQEKGLMRLEHELREELARSRREVSEDAFRDREERAHSSSLLSQVVTTQVTQSAA